MVLSRSLAAAAVLSLLAIPGAARPRHFVPRPPAPEQYGPPIPPTPYDLCDRAITAARTKPIPDTLLPAISRVESGRLDPATGRVRAWPWTINVEGTGTFFETKEEAVAAVKALQARGQRSVDVGCMQVNLMYHPAAFADLDAAFDPPTNAAYAARFLLALYSHTKDWSLATAWYHSAEQDRGEDYQRRVFGRVVTPMGPPSLASLGAGAGKWPPAGVMFGAIPPSSTKFGAFAPPSTIYGAFAVPSLGADTTPNALRGLTPGLSLGGLSAFRRR